MLLLQQMANVECLENPSTQKDFSLDAIACHKLDIRMLQQNTKRVKVYALRIMCLILLQNKLKG